MPWEEPPEDEPDEDDELDDGEPWALPGADVDDGGKSLHEYERRVYGDRSL